MSTTFLGAFIRKTRKKSGISLRELSRRVKISAPAMSGIERGLKNPSEPVLQRIASGLSIDFRKLQELDSWTALKDLREMLEEDRDLCRALTTAVNAMKTGQVAPAQVAERLMRACNHGGYTS